MTPEEVQNLAQKDKEKCEELEDLAFRGAELPTGLPFHQGLLFLKFRYLYQYAKIVQMPLEQGRREKQEILNAYIIDKANDILFQTCGDLWEKIAESASDIQKDKELSENPKIIKLLNVIFRGELHYGK